MSRYSQADETDIYRALVVQKFGRVDVVEYLRAQSRADDGREVVR